MAVFFFCVCQFCINDKEQTKPVKPSSLILSAIMVYSQADVEVKKNEFIKYINQTRIYLQDTHTIMDQ